MSTEQTQQSAPVPQQLPAHTPGPWRVEMWGDHYRINGGAEEHPFYVARTHGNSYGDEIDARLIAAAPDLLAALQEADLQIEYLHDKFQPTSTGVAVLTRIRAAIAKATGETP